MYVDSLLDLIHNYLIPDSSMFVWAYQDPYLRISPCYIYRHLLFCDSVFPNAYMAINPHFGYLVLAEHGDQTYIHNRVLYSYIHIAFDLDIYPADPLHRYIHNYVPGSCYGYFPYVM